MPNNEPILRQIVFDATGGAKGPYKDIKQDINRPRQVYSIGEKLEIGEGCEERWITVRDNLTGNVERVIVDPESLRSNEEYLQLALESAEVPVRKTKKTSPSLWQRISQSDTMFRIKRTTAITTAVASLVGLSVFGGAKGCSIGYDNPSREKIAEFAQITNYPTHETSSGQDDPKHLLSRFNNRQEGINEALEALADGYISETEILGQGNVWRRTGQKFDEFRTTRNQVGNNDIYLERVKELIRRGISSINGQKVALENIDELRNQLQTLEQNRSLTLEERENISDSLKSVSLRLSSPEGKVGISTNTELGSQIKESIEGYDAYLNELKENGYFLGLVNGALRRDIKNGMDAGAAGGIVVGMASGCIPAILLPLYTDKLYERRKQRKEKEKPKLEPVSEEGLTGFELHVAKEHNFRSRLNNQQL